MEPKLFSAPLDFAPEVLRNTNYYCHKIVEREPLPFDIKVWVCNPKQSFVIDASVLDEVPNLKILATPSTGTNHIDLEECKKRGIKVLSLLDDRRRLNDISASAEFTFKLLLDALRLPPALELQDKNIGIVGLGRIGSRLMAWIEAFNASVTVHDPAYFYSVPLPNLFRTCDAVVICCTLNDETRGMITPELIRSMKYGAALVNTARGEIIDEDGLYRTMVARPDLRVALDVLTGEVDGSANPYRMKGRGAIVTPHIAGETYDSRTKAARIIIDLIERNDHE